MLRHKRMTVDTLEIARRLAFALQEGKQSVLIYDHYHHKVTVAVDNVEYTFKYINGE